MQTRDEDTNIVLPSARLKKIARRTYVVVILTGVFFSVFCSARFFLQFLSEKKMLTGKRLVAAMGYTRGSVPGHSRAGLLLACKLGWKA
jgi:hypothetical protein